MMSCMKYTTKLNLCLGVKIDKYVYPYKPLAVLLYKRRVRGFTFLGHDYLNIYVSMKPY